MKTKSAYLLRTVAIGFFLAGGTVSIPSNVQAEPPDCTNAEGPWMAEPCYLCSTAEAGWAMGKGEPKPCLKKGGMTRNESPVDDVTDKPGQNRTKLAAIEPKTIPPFPELVKTPVK